MWVYDLLLLSRYFTEAPGLGSRIESDTNMMSLLSLALSTVPTTIGCLGDQGGGGGKGGREGGKQE